MLQVTELKGDRARHTPRSQESSLFLKVPSKVDILFYEFSLTPSN